MEAPNNQPFPWRLFLCELSGTAVLVLVGLSLVIGMFVVSLAARSCRWGVASSPTFPKGQ